MTDTMRSRMPRVPADLAPTSTAIAYGAILAVGSILFWISETRPSLLPFWAPWEFSWPEFLAAALVLFWFVRGLALAPARERLPRWRQVSFLAGVACIYIVLQTHFDYMAQHMFALNRVQQVTVHDLAPFLIGLGGATTTVARGMPRRLCRLANARAFRWALTGLSRPLIAALLFVGGFYFWLIPAIHFRAMLDARLYAVMNWSMVIDGVLFWSLTLDHRPQPPSRLSFAIRAAMAFGIMTPQTLLGAVITLAPRDLYPSYTLCGRLFPEIDAMTDQHLGGLITWIPPLLIGAFAILILLWRIMREDGAAQGSSSSMEAS